MNAARVAGITAIVSGLALLVLVLVGSFAPGLAAPTTGTQVVWTAPMMGGYPMGPGMMGGGMMGHMYGYGSGYATNGSAGGAISGATEVKVALTDFAFSPSQIDLPANAAVNLTLTNNGTVVHDLTVPALGIHVSVQPGQSQTAGLRSLPAGTYPAYCSVPGHAQLGMRATVVVR